MKWIRIHAGKYTFGLGAKPRFTIVQWNEGGKGWELSGDELLAPVHTYSLKAAKDHAAIVMAKAQAKWEKEQGSVAKTESQSLFSMGVNGHDLKGWQVDGKWVFECQSWPDLEMRWNGDTIIDNILAEFMKRALAGSITVKELVKKLT